jgi:PAS domain S-box-containing protein
LESQFRLLVSGVADYAILTLDVNGLVTSWNLGAERLKGYRPSEIIGRHFSAFYPPHDVAAGLPAAELAEATASGSVEVEGWRVRKDGSQFWASVLITALFDDDHRLIGFGKLTRDITERRKADRRLHAVESIGRVGSWEMDITTTAMVRTKILLELYGIDPSAFDEGFGRAVERIHPDDRARVETAIDVCRRTGLPFKERYRLFREDDGKLRWFDVRGERVYDNDQPVLLAGAVIDVTEQVRVAQVLEKARDVAVEASRQKSAFLATMSHEIRTPMNAVIGMTGLLLDTALDAEQREFAETIHSSGDALLGIINDILDFSVIESGGIDLQMHQFDLRACVDEALDLVAVTAAGKDLELIGQVHEGCPVRLVGDVTRLRQVLVNLLSNAVKFTARGEVVLTVVPVGSTGDLGEVALRFAVTDSGIGIAADRLPTLFDPFSQVDGSTTRTYGGTGLGLAISHRLVEAMGASLGVGSVSGVGSTFDFTVHLALASEAEGQSESKPPAGLGGRLALVVDDNATDRGLLRRQMEGWQMHVTEASGADEVITMFVSGGRCDIAVVDMWMPGMNGAELGARLRASPDTMLLPMILLSSDVERLSGPDRAPFSGSCDAVVGT